MIVAVTKPLFAWDCLEDNPSLTTVKKFLESVPDAKLLDGLRRHRGRGRNDCPVHVAWGVVLLRIALRHTSFVAILAELARNKPSGGSSALRSPRMFPVPGTSRGFWNVLGQEPHFSELRRIFDAMIQRLGQAVPDLGRDTAGDSTALHARRKEKEAAVRAEIAQGLPQPSGGRKEYTDDDGKVTKIVEWFGYKLHLLVDAKHEVVLAYQVTTANAADCKSLPDLVEQGQANLPAGRIETLAYDKAADDNESHRLLDKAKIRPVIQNRHLWKDQTEQMLPGHNGRSNIVYDEAGTVHCYDRSSSPIVRHPMAYIGYEPQRETLKYRCPARHEGWPCLHDAACNAGKSYGKTVRVDRTIDLRRFPPIPRATKKFRAALQRPHVGGTGQCPAEDFLGRRRRQPRRLATISCDGLRGAGRPRGLRHALGRAPRREGTLGKLRLSSIQKALRETPATG